MAEFPLWLAGMNLFHRIVSSLRRKFYLTWTFATKRRKLNLNENIWLNMADDCHLQCHHGRVIDASGRELCECRRVPEREFHHLRVTSDDDDADDDDDGRGYVTAAGNEALNCPKVPCTRMCPHGFQVICIFHLNKISHQFPPGVKLNMLKLIINWISPKAFYTPN